MIDESNGSTGTRIKLLALDMDDTLLGRDLRISPGNQRALAAAEALGVRVVLASGRSPAALLPYVRTLGQDRHPGHFIACNGSLIVATDTGEEALRVTLDPDLLAECWDLAQALRQPIQTYSRNSILVNLDNPLTQRDTQLTGLVSRVVDRAEFIAEGRVKLVLPGDPLGLNPVEARFKETFKDRANMYRSKPYFFEIMPLTADKGLALEYLAALHGLPRAEVMAVGDSWNDEGMLRWAGVSVAMANSAEAILPLADWITTRSHDDDGVAEAVERYIL